MFIGLVGQSFITMGNDSVSRVLSVRLSDLDLED